MDIAIMGFSDTNDRGKLLEDFITENNLCLFNSNQHTYLHPGSGSFTAIDLFTLSSFLIP